MTSLEEVLARLRAHEEELERMGVLHAAVFGSVARGQATRDSDVDILVDLDNAKPIGIFEYVRVKLYINEILDGTADVVTARP